MPHATTLSFDFSPVRLDYCAALRGLAPPAKEGPFLYAQAGGFDPKDLICMAASNPHGSFFGVLASQEQAEQASKMARTQDVHGVTFVTKSEDLPNGLHYLFCEHAGPSHQESVREDLFALAEKKLAAGGLFAYRYHAYARLEETLRFLLDAHIPDLAPEQEGAFLKDIKALNPSFFEQRPTLLSALDDAIKAGRMAPFVEACSLKEEAGSGTFDAMKGLLPRGFSFVGDADYGANYLFLAATLSAHDALEKCRDRLFYEPIKDFARGTLVRNDVWVKRPVEQTDDLASLFGPFTFGIMGARETIPSQFQSLNGSIGLSSPLFARLIELMCTLPVSIGDFLEHPAGFGFSADDVLSSIQTLVACGIAQPMREHYENKGIAKGKDIPSCLSSFNKHLLWETIKEPTIRLASPVIGSAITLGVREALVLQATARVGIDLSAGALQPELKKMIAANPALAARVTSSSEPTDDIVHAIVTDVLEKDMVRWYAYGLLAA